MHKFSPTLRTAIAVIMLAALVSSALVCRAAEKMLPYEQHQDVIYGDADGVALVMDVFTPTGPKNGIGIIDVASGAWASDRGKIHDHMRAGCYDIFCGRGYTVFAVRPGSLSRFPVPDMIQHLRTATKWVQHHAGLYGIDPQSLGLMGASAGGHLASLLVVLTPPTDKGKGENAKTESGNIDQPFKAVGVFFPPTEFMNYHGTNDFAKDEQSKKRILALAAPRDHSNCTPDTARLAELARSISPALLVDRKQPPFLIIHGDADPLVPLHQSELLLAALKKQGGSAELIVKKGGGHPWLTIRQEVKKMADWFDTQLKAKQTSGGHAESSTHE